MISWDDTKVAEDDFFSVDYNAMVTDQKSRALVSSDAGAPSTTPTMIGAIYFDTTNNKFYLARGTSGSTDWRKVVTQ